MYRYLYICSRTFQDINVPLERPCNLYYRYADKGNTFKRKKTQRIGINRAARGEKGSSGGRGTITMMRSIPFSTLYYNFSMTQCGDVYINKYLRRWNGMGSTDTRMCLMGAGRTEPILKRSL